MNAKSYVLAISSVTLLNLLFGCTSGKRAFLQVEICMTESQDRALFVHELQLIAQSQGSKFLDNSADTEKNLLATRNPNVEAAVPRPLINMGMQLDDGTTLVATNLGLSRNQVLVSFLEGSNGVSAHRFADMAVSRLKQHWHLKTVPPGTGAKAESSCK